MLDPQDLLARASRPAQDALRLHPFYRGKVATAAKCPVRSLDDLSIWYSPGVAAPCTAIHQRPELVWEYTNRANVIAVVSDCSRVLGLGDIGPAAGDGGQGPAVQVPGRRRRCAAGPGHAGCR
jgi:malate dehydrogenase (oxaloacetate-decarboxylating)